MATARTELSDTLAGISLFADVGAAELNAIAHIVEERRYAAGERILRQGISGSAFYIILDGEATIRVNGKDYGTLGRGEFFGEISVLLGRERLRPRQQALEERPPAEHPSRRRVGGDDGMPNAGAAERI